MYWDSFRHNRNSKKIWKEITFQCGKSGRKSVTTSEEFQNLNSAGNITQTQQGNERLNYVDSRGVKQNLTQQVKNISGGAVYRSKFWVDSELQNQSDVKKVRVQDLTRMNTLSY